MPQPTARDVHVDQLLSNISILFMHEQDQYIADRMFPLVPVNKQSDKILKYTKDFWFRNRAQVRAPATQSEGGGYGIDTSQNYFCDNFAYHYDIPVEVMDNFDNPFDPEEEATRLVTDAMLIRREIDFVTDFVAAGKWTNEDATARNWQDDATGTPIVDIEAAKQAVRQLTARKPNKMAIGDIAWSKVKHHADFVDRYKHTQAGIITEELVAAVVGLENIFVGETIQTTSEEGATFAAADIWADVALLVFTPPRPMLFTPSAGYTFVWRQRGLEAFIRRFELTKEMATRIESMQYFDQVQTSADLGYFFGDLIT